MKICAKCGETKSLEAFRKAGRQVTGRVGSWCILCIGEAANGKTCTKCGLDQFKVNFSVEKIRGVFRVRPDCDACRKAYVKDHRKVPDVKVRLRAYQNTWGAKNRLSRYALIREMKESKPCADCRKFYPAYVMDYDHLNPSDKMAGIGQLVSQPCAWSVVEAEIDKCELVCACCHRLRTYHGVVCRQGRRLRHNYLVMSEVKMALPCLDCGLHFKPAQMDFDHFDPSHKTDNIARLMGEHVSVLIEELRKCHLVCANCHRVREATGHRPKLTGDYLVKAFLRVLELTPYPQDRRSTVPRHKRGPYKKRVVLNGAVA